MNRPNKELLTEWSLNSYADYTNELEKYCDELEKREQPMKVHKKSIMEELSIGNAWFCPSCDNWLIRLNNFNYCPRCGQRVVFEDE